MPSSSTQTSVLRSVRDLVRWGASQFKANGLHFGHGTDNALDEAFHLVLHALHLTPDLPTVYFQPWLQSEPQTILDLCAGSGCIGIACAHAFPDAQVDLAELSPGALAVCKANIERHDCGEQVRALKSDLFNGLGEMRYDLIVSNPPYVPVAEWKALPQEFHQEPRMALAAGKDGMDLVARILAEAPSRLVEGGWLVCEVGGSVPEFEARWPRLPVTWVEFERGGDGVFIISREDLIEHL